MYSRCNITCAIALLIISLCVGCKSNRPQHKTSENIQLKSVILADTIIYDVLLAPLDSSNTWEVECLNGLNHKALINFIFDGIYSGKFEAYSFDDNELLTANEVKSIEKTKGFDRDLLTKMQFKEIWSTDSIGNFNKHIVDVIIGIATFSEQKTFLGHKGIIKVKFN